MKLIKIPARKKLLLVFYAALGIFFVSGLPQIAMAGSRATSRSCVNGVCKTETRTGSGNRASSSSSASASSRGGSTSSVYTYVSGEDNVSGGGYLPTMQESARPYDGIESILANFGADAKAEEQQQRQGQPEEEEKEKESGAPPYCPEIISDGHDEETTVVLDPNCAQEPTDEDQGSDALVDFEVGFLEYQILEQLIL